MNTYTATDAHRDGRHVSTHPDDRRFWERTCPLCAAEAFAAAARSVGYDVHVLDGE